LPEHPDAQNGKAGAFQGWRRVLDDGLAAPPSAEPPPRRAGPVLDAARFCTLKAVRLLARLLARLDVRGVENVDTDGPFLLCADHQSYLDAILLFSALPYHVVRRMMSRGKTRIFSRPGMRWLAERYDVAVVDADSNLVQAMQISARALRDGKVVLLFPEGERTLDGEIGPLRRGAAILAAHLNVPIVPVVIDGPYKIWPRGRGIQGRAPVTISFLPPLRPAAEPGGGAAAFEPQTVRLTEDLRGRMEVALKAIRSAT
jgi:1-acyl-sn-glycerol-3-phosphate acyltransferase